MKASLNPAQLEAVSTLTGPLLVLAGAGTGKTRVVTYRIAELIRHGIRPARILAVTFTNKAAGEMQQRTAGLLGKRLPEKPEISTFHSLCVRILRRHATRLGYPAQFAIYDRGDQESVARSALREIRIDDAVLRPGDLLAQIGRWKNASVRPAQASQVAQTDAEHLAAAAYRRYQQSLFGAGAMDFDDLLLVSEDLFQQFPEVRQSEAARFDRLLVDEYQDTNGSQYRIIRALAAAHRNLCVVGDDDQSIYGWRGAEVTHILQFKRDWPEARVVRLEDNYRSTKQIIALANRLIAFNKHRHGKVLRAHSEGQEPRVIQQPDETAEAKFVAEELADLIARGVIQPRDAAILFRTNEQPRALEQELRRLKVPYTLIGGMSFFDRKEVRDVLAYLKLLVSPADEVSLLRIVNTPPRGLGPKAVETLRARAVAEGRPLGEVLAIADSVEGLTDTARQAAIALHGLLHDYRQRATREAPAKLAAELVDHVRYRDEIDRQYKEPDDRAARWTSVEEVINSAAAYGQRSPRATLAGFLEEVALTGRDDDDKQSKLERNSVVLMTLHSAKGLEFPHVYLVGLEEGLLPHHRAVAVDGPAIDEERRLCYVGVTRARERLTLTMSLTRMKWGKPRDTIPSRFLFELVGKADNPQAIAALKRAGEELGPKRKARPKRRPGSPRGAR